MTWVGVNAGGARPFVPERRFPRRTCVCDVAAGGPELRFNYMVGVEVGGRRKRGWVCVGGWGALGDADTWGGSLANAARGAPKPEFKAAATSACEGAALAVSSPG